eukprot:CAMPEP_0176321162 /NCGR_PEP_ID=MMETSP0121_2-20121125/71203_1 /TAXON_ID=160619 /ORGANISM="Kryptoperidinium foliaceum, Strain CCMP 1326" /LENGTH=80 /DNA_ID=CAMNT_0017663589 /DNA_START=6 /DNA_END=245 /DNA_ORIENTATION=+
MGKLGLAPPCARARDRARARRGSPRLAPQVGQAIVALRERLAALGQRGPGLGESPPERVDLRRHVISMLLRPGLGAQEVA